MIICTTVEMVVILFASVNYHITIGALWAFENIREHLSVVCHEIANLGVSCFCYISILCSAPS